MTEPATVTVSTAQPEDFFQLLKPRVMSLVIFTAVTGLVVAGGDLDWLSSAIAILCIAVGAGAAGALNMALEGETDALMRRTRGRPVAAGRVNKNDAMAFGVILSVFSVMLLGMTTNWLAGGLLLMTILYYAVFYTLLLKRRTPQNIVIGGAAGAFPPVIGWAAATGEAPWPAWLLFAIIFLWTPPHSWALALYSAGDYARAGIPMMPVARGAKSTRPSPPASSASADPFIWPSRSPAASASCSSPSACGAVARAISLTRPKLWDERPHCMMCARRPNRPATFSPSRSCI
jgi:protoheme IX farnesyltransferase